MWFFNKKVEEAVPNKKFSWGKWIIFSVAVALLAGAVFLMLVGGFTLLGLGDKYTIGGPIILPGEVVTVKAIQGVSNISLDGELYGETEVVVAKKNGWNRKISVDKIEGGVEKGTHLMLSLNGKYMVVSSDDSADYQSASNLPPDSDGIMVVKRSPKVKEVPYE